MTAPQRSMALRRVMALAQPAERRGLLMLAIATLLPFTGLAVWAHLWSPASWEPGILGATTLQDGLFGDVFRVINLLGNLPTWSMLVVLLAAIAWVANGARAALLVGLSLAADLAAFVVKILVERQRPESAGIEQFFGFESFAFPSGHVVRAVALCAALAWVYAPPVWRFRLALVAGLAAGLVMGYARVALGVHWPTDALGGALLGLAWFALTAWLITSRIERWKPQRPNSA